MYESQIKRISMVNTHRLLVKRKSVYSESEYTIAIPLFLGFSIFFCFLLVWFGLACSLSDLYVWQNGTPSIPFAILLYFLFLGNIFFVACECVCISEYVCAL